MIIASASGQENGQTSIFPSCIFLSAARMAETTIEARNSIPNRSVTQKIAGSQQIRIHEARRASFSRSGRYINFARNGNEGWGISRTMIFFSGRADLVATKRSDLLECARERLRRAQ